jgi:hypothetical protein
MAWRTVEWSLVMAALSWLFVRMWTEAPYDRRRPRARPKWLQWFTRR